MKTNKFADLINFGLSQKTLMTLSEGEINTLHKTLVEGKKKKETTEQAQPQKFTKTVSGVKLSPGTSTSVGNLSITNSGGTTTVTQTENEMKEENEIDEKKPKEGKYNPWAICHSQLGPKKTRKFERCVKEIKKQISEGKDPFAILLENKIVSLLEKHISPKMKKKELLDLINNKKMKNPTAKIGTLGMMETDTPTKPAEPKIKPGTKPEPAKKPFDPFKPNPSQKPNPKANTKKTEAKEADAPTIAPTKPKPETKPITKPEPGKKPFDPFRPDPSQKPNPKAKLKKQLPNWLSFKNLGLKLK